MEMELLHEQLFASKWMQDMHFALGDTFCADSAFALLYVMYNPVCRRDILRKNRLTHKKIADALHPLKMEYLGKIRLLGCYIKSRWAMLKFAIQNRALADCNPMLVLSASQQSDAKVFKDVNRMFMLVRTRDRDVNAKQTSLFNAVTKNVDQNAELTIPSSKATWLQRIQNCWKRSRTGVAEDERDENAPKAFVDHFASKRKFVEQNIEEEARLSLLTLLMFPDPEDFGSSIDCQRYKTKFDENSTAFRKTFRTIFRLSKELKLADEMKRANSTRKERIFLRIADMVLGDEMKLLRVFHNLTETELVDMFLRHEFPECESDYTKAPSIGNVFKQLFVVEREKIFPESDIEAPPEPCASSVHELESDPDQRIEQDPSISTLHLTEVVTYEFQHVVTQANDALIRPQESFEVAGTKQVAVEEETLHLESNFEVNIEGCSHADLQIRVRSESVDLSELESEDEKAPSQQSVAVELKAEPLNVNAKELQTAFDFSLEADTSKRMPRDKSDVYMKSNVYSRDTRAHSAPVLSRSTHESAEERDQMRSRRSASSEATHSSTIVTTLTAQGKDLQDFL
jgi:hypothetical protein